MTPDSVWTLATPKSATFTTCKKLLVNNWKKEQGYFGNLVKLLYFVFIHEEICGFKIAVDDVVLVEVAHAFGDVN